MKALEHCRWKPRWASRMGCIRGCLDYLGIEMNDSWLYGGTGFAFAINVHTTVCPSGATAWRTDELDELGQNLGFHSESTVCADTAAADELDRAREAAWVRARDAIAAGYPCYAWELRTPEYYVVYGYDESGYYYSGVGCETGAGPLPWRKLGESPIGIVELVCLRPGTAASPEKTVRDALSFAGSRAFASQDETDRDYHRGTDAFTAWIDALETGIASDMGTRYNAGVWLECRRNAVGFLTEARERLRAAPSSPFDDAVRYYAAVAANLSSVAHVYPWHAYVEEGTTLPVDERSRSAADSLRKARRAETAGLHALEQIVAGL
ncbi:MAG: hypothetical protein ACOC2D_04275 [Spirochaetota bacterium]